MILTLMVGSDRLIIDGGHPDPSAVFERQSKLAWFIEREGYRESASDWSVVEIADLPGATARGRKLVHLASLIDDGGHLPIPEVRIEPASEGRVRVTASVRLVVQDYGETSPHEADRAAVVSYGSVVRAGPLCLAPLYEEQAESLRDGAMTLPRPQGAFFDEDGRFSSLDRGRPKNPRRWLLWAWGATWLLSFPEATLFLIFVNYASDAAPVGGRTLVYSIGGVWFLLIFFGLVIHRLVTNYVHAGLPEP